MSEDASSGQAALNAIAGAVMTQRLNGVARSELLGRELDQARILAAAREREVADRDAHIIELERRLADMQQELAVQRADAQRRWMLGIPHAARRVRNKLASPKETTPS